MIVDMSRVQQFAELIETVEITVHGLVVFAGETQPGAGLSVQYQYISTDFTLGQQYAEARNVIIELPVVVPPRLMAEERSRIVAFADALERITLQMLAEQINTVHHLPLINPFQFFEFDVPAAERKGFREHLFFAGLGADGSHLNRRGNGFDMASQPVHAGYMIVLILRHDRAVGSNLGTIGFLQHVMAGDSGAMGFTPVVNLLHEVVHEQQRDQPPEAVPGTPEIAAVMEELRQQRQQFFAVGFCVFRLHDERPGNAVARHLRFVGKEAGQFLPVVLTKTVLIRLINLLKKSSGHFSVEGIDIIRIDFVITVQYLRVVTAGRFNRRAVNAEKGDSMLCPRRFGRLDRFQAQIFLLIIQSQSVDAAVSESAGPAVLVIGPAVHAVFPPFVDTGFDAVEPFFTHIPGQQAAAGVHEIAAESGFMHQVDLIAQFLRLQLVIPAPERNRAVLQAGIFQLSGDLHLLLYLKQWFSYEN